MQVDMPKTVAEAKDLALRALTQLVSCAIFAIVNRVNNRAITLRQEDPQ